MKHHFLPTGTFIAACVAATLLPLTGASAQEGWKRYPNTRVGGPLTTLYDQTPESCAAACDKDRRCQSFDMEIKPGYCYLRDRKMDQSENTQHGTVLVHFERVSPGTKANPNANTGRNSRAFCGQYAKTAQAQQQENIRLSCGFKGGRWLTNYSIHFDWCMGASTANANSETNTRNNQLNQCRNKGNRSNSAFCDGYAKSAVAHQQQNIQLRCGYTGGRWQSNYNNHYNWCMRSNSTAVNYETNARVLALNNCRNRGSNKVRDVLGRVWYEQEVAGWQGVWTRVGNTNEFTANFKHPNGTTIGGRLKMTVSGNNLSIYRWNPGTWGTCTYTGVFANNFTTVSGRYRCTRQDGSWMPWYNWAARVTP